MKTIDFTKPKSMKLSYQDKETRHILRMAKITKNIEILLYLSAIQLLCSLICCSIQDVCTFKQASIIFGIEFGAAFGLYSLIYICYRINNWFEDIQNQAKKIERTQYEN